MPTKNTKKRSFTFEDVVMDEHGNLKPKKAWDPKAKKTVVAWNRTAAKIERLLNHARKHRGKEPVA